MQDPTRFNGWSLGFGRTSTCFADQILEITLIWVVWQATQSSTYTGMAAFAQRAPFWILGFVGAGYVDKVGSARILRKLNLMAAGVALLGIAVAHSLGQSKVMIAIVIASVSFLIGIARSMEAPALTALVPGFSNVWSVQGLNNLLDNSKRLGRLAAPMPTLFLGTVPTHWLLGICACGYLLMSWVANSLHMNLPTTRHKARLLGPTFVTTAKQIYRSGQLGLIMGASVLYAFLHGAAYFSIVPRVLLSQSGGAVGAYASIISAFALGGISSNLLIARIEVSRYTAAVAIGMAIAGAAFLLIGQVQNAWVLWLIGFIGGMSLPFQDVFITCLIQRDAPKEMLARSHALWRLGCEAGIGLGMLLGGIAADAISGSTLLIVAGLGIICIAWLVFSQDNTSSR